MLFYICWITAFFEQNGDILMLKDVDLNVEMDEYLRDLLDYGLGKYEIEFADADTSETFHLSTILIDDEMKWIKQHTLQEKRFAAAS